MRISPEVFIEGQKDKTYEELLAVRDELIRVIRTFEAEGDHDPEDVLTGPIPDGNYYCNMNYLGELCKLIADKFGEEYRR